MKKGAGERLFEAIANLPDEMILEAEKDGVMQENPTGMIQEQSVSKEIEKSEKRKRVVLAAIGGYMKFLPVAACLCIVFGSAFYILNSFIGADKNIGWDLSSSAGSAIEEGLEMDESNQKAYDQGEDGAFMDGGSMSGEFMEEDSMEAGSMEESSMEEDSAGSAEDSSMDYALEGSANQGENNNSHTETKLRLPIRYDAYEGPVFPLTATGDTQKLTARRSLKGVITTENKEENVQPLLNITDVYKLKNTSAEDKTIQLVYPFTTTLNLAYDVDILQVQGKEESYQTPVMYHYGDSVRQYQQNDYLSKASSIEDYQQIFNVSKAQEKPDYQEQALEKEADWNQPVSVYTFSEFVKQENDTNRQKVIGVAVNGTKADVLTYGFDYVSQREEETTNYCFFFPEEQEKLLLIVTGEQNGEPKLGFYSNLDCEEQIDGIDCKMTKQTMSYADALRLCSNEAARQLEQDYGQGRYEGKLPEYMNKDAAFQVLTVMDEEEGFYHTLTERYHSTDLKEIFAQLFGEVRVVYAMTTVTIPAKQSVRVIAQIQKRQSKGHYICMDDEEDRKGTEKEDYQYDFLSHAKSHLNMEKTVFQLRLSEEWKLQDDNIKLKPVKESIWKAELKKKSYYLKVSSKMETKGNTNK